MVEEQIVELLNAAPDVAGPLAMYNFDADTEARAIFGCGNTDNDEPPQDATNPCIYIRQETTAPNTEEMRGQRGGEAVYTVLTRWDKKTAPKARREHAVEIWKALRRAAVDPDGFDASHLVCTLPSRHWDAEGFPGCELTVTCTLFETLPE